MGKSHASQCQFWKFTQTAGPLIKVLFPSIVFPAFHPAAGKPAASALPAGHWLRPQRNGYAESAKCANGTNTVKIQTIKNKIQAFLPALPTYI